MVNRAVVLLSGGLDSATTLYIAKQKFRCLCLIFDYGQRHKKEIAAAKKIARASGSAYRIVKLDLNLASSSLTNKKISVKRSKAGIPHTYVPGRNTIFLSIALSFAEDIKAQAVFIGANAIDFSGYPDCRPAYYRAFRELARLATRTKGIKVYTPLINLTKAQIIQKGIRLGVPYGSTWSCYRGKSYPCNACDSCFYRAKGFKEAGIKDPLIK
ncbi:MAG: 7-cyano-7-deazaguanine synthase QueC [Candidatus Omnitrophica bacterium]|nr:7-cyano-7-deazaguanine synthase QueC [Candidatus Omnitrophota bacterium]MDD5236245.1 7-cyano-7-deazaguanine synthase QueC [Candidatus Omnitrophota bacterium]MDD5611031.1 7-cyano-7-deazaguanine synthase QueC [Candidatus Omnitrophota bacterium]